MSSTTRSNDVVISGAVAFPEEGDVVGLPIAGAKRRRETYQIICGDAKDVVPTLPQVHAVFSSPPYWDKRRYGDSDAEVGQERGVEDYIEALVSILSAVPLHPKGSMVINIGDKRGRRGQLLDIPHRFLQAMVEAGFLWADHIVWAKAVAHVDGRTDGGFMPEPTRKRMNGNALEELFRFVRARKVSDAWTDTCAVAIPRQNAEDVRYLPPELMRCHTSVEGRAVPNVWRIPVGQTRQDHHGVFPSALVERAVAMCCPVWVNPDGSLPERIIEMVPYDEGRGADRYFGKRSLVAADDQGEMRERCGRNDTGRSCEAKQPVTLGWTAMDPEGSPAIVLDPFCGRGTTGEVSLRLGRSFIGIDLYDDYCELSRQCCDETIRHLEERGLDPLALIR